MVMPEVVLDSIKSVATTPDHALEHVSGMMDRLNLRLLRNLAAVAVSPDSPYVEVGVYKGLSLASVAQVVAPAQAIGIDNFSQFDPDGANQAEASKALSANGLTNAQIIDTDFETGIDGLLATGLRNRVGLFFIDAAHDYRSQLVGLLKARELIARSGVIVVDDANYAHVRQASKDFLDHFPDFALVFEAYTRAAPMNLPEPERIAARNGWGNGVHVLYHDPDQGFERIRPQTIGKSMFEDSHDVMRHELGPIASEVLLRCTELANVNPGDPEFAAAAAGIRDVVLAHRVANPGLHPHRNTYSDGLESERLAALR